MITFPVYLSPTRATPPPHPHKVGQILEVCVFFEKFHLFIYSLLKTEGTEGDEQEKYMTQNFRFNFCLLVGVLLPNQNCDFR